MSNQLPGPDSSHYEQGFDPTGADMNGLQAPPTFPVGVELPGNAIGYKDGVDLSGLAQIDAFPQGNTMGSLGEDGVGDFGPGRDFDLAVSAGYQLITSFEQMYGGISGSEPAPYGEQDIQ
jgi:hypothetical protein